MDRPLLHLLVPPWSGTGIHETFGHRFPPMSLLVLAAHARRAGWDAEVVDLNYDRSPLDGSDWEGHRTRLGHRRRSGKPDLAALTVWTAPAPNAYRIADAYRRRGVPVVLGGVHASLLPGEAKNHADSVVCGEADHIFATVLEDAAAGRLQPLYQGAFQGMENVPLNHEWADIYRQWPLTRYAPLNTLQTTRGCRFNCDFCSVIRINGRGSRHSPVERVIEEVKVLKKYGQHAGDFAYVFFLDDDMAADLDYTVELAEAILRAGVKFTWGAQASIGLTRDNDVLDLVARAGLRAVFTGFESVSREALIECNKKNRPGQFGEAIAKLHQRGIAIEGGFIFGFDHDKPDVFEHTADFVDRIDCDVAHFSILTPYPGTHTFSRMYAEGRITTFDWRRYNLYYPVHQPAQMTADQLHAGLRRAYRMFYDGHRRWRRFRRHVFDRDPRFHGAFTTCNWNYHHRYRDPRLFDGPPFETDAAELERLALASAAPAQEALNVAFRHAASNVASGAGSRRPRPNSIRADVEPMADHSVSDDRVLKPTRVISVVIIPVLAAAFVILYLFPTRTGQLWAWEMRPTMTAMVMGGGYLSGAYFFYRAATVRQWHRIGLGFVAITVFTAMLGIATIVHWDRFNHGHVSFWAWALLYFSTPILLPWLWARNRASDPHTLEPGDRLVPTSVRRAMVAVGAAQLTVAAVMFLRPTAIAGHAPWTLTPLTCRSLAAFAAFPSIIYLAFAFEKRWSSFEILIEVAIAGMALIAIAAVRARAEFDGDAVVVWGWRIGLAVALVLLIALRLAMARPDRAPVVEPREV